MPLFDVEMRNRIGACGFGEVFAGVFRGTVCAVKKVNSAGIAELVFVEELKI